MKSDAESGSSMSALFAVSLPFSLMSNSRLPAGSPVSQSKSGAQMERVMVTCWSASSGMLVVPSIEEVVTGAPELESVTAR